MPIRFNYDDNYYNSAQQGIPEQGYTPIVEKILDHPEITVELDMPFSREMEQGHDHTFYTGPIDAYFGFDRVVSVTGRSRLNESTPRAITRGMR